MRTRTHPRTDLIPYHNLRSIVGRALILGLLAIVSSMPIPAEAVSIRVLLLQNLPIFPLSVPPDYTILTQPGGLLPADADYWRTLRAQASAEHIRIPEHGIEVE